jgi:hypothetical protein
MVGCSKDKIQGTQACDEHVADWKKSVHDRSKATLNGIRRVLQRPGERQEWQNVPNATIQQPHDDEVETQPTIKRKTYFSPNRSYCVETACAPCGVVIAWTKFPKSESPTNILNWLDELFPNKEDRPAYICIDKACQVFKTAVGSERWKDWTDTTRFIVDTYHYNNHRATDEICRKWCNPAPKDGSAPNLVGETIDEDGNLIQWREFNTQVCEQLNAWLAGYESILKRMTSKNFNWFIHTMIVYHVKHVLAKMTSMEDDESGDEESSDEESSDEESSDEESSDEDEESSHEKSSNEKSSDEESSHEKSNQEEEMDSKSKSSSGSDKDDESGDEESGDEKSSDEKSSDEKSSDEKSNQEEEMNSQSESSSGLDNDDDKESNSTNSSDHDMHVSSD